MPQNDFPAGSSLWRGVAQTLCVGKALADIRLVAFAIILHASPVSPYLRIPADDCRYIGARGLWSPGWSGDCPRWTLRDHFYL